MHVERVDGKWRATDIVRIEPIEDRNEGWLDRLVRWILSPMPDQIKHDEHFKVIKTGTCQRFSTAIKRMLFCGDGPFTTDIRSELRAGEMIPIAGGAGRLKTFLGDADSLALALFLGADRGLYGYDGEHVERIADADFESATVYDLPKLGRTLVVSPNAMFEVRVKGDGHELVKLAGLGDRALFRSPLLAAPDGNAVLAFAQDGVYRLKDGALTVVWSSAEHGSVDPYGGTPPTDVAGWGGILFTTHLGKEIQFHLLRPCSESTGSFHTR